MVTSRVALPRASEGMPVPPANGCCCAPVGTDLLALSGVDWANESETVNIATAIATTGIIRYQWTVRIIVPCTATAGLTWTPVQRACFESEEPKPERMIWK